MPPYPHSCFSLLECCLPLNGSFTSLITAVAWKMQDEKWSYSFPSKFPVRHGDGRASSFLLKSCNTYFVLSNLCIYYIENNRMRKQKLKKQFIHNLNIVFIFLYITQWSIYINIVLSCTLIFLFVLFSNFIVGIWRADIICTL